MAYRYGTDKQGVPFVRYEDFVNGYDNSIPPQQASVIDNYKLIIEDMENAKKRLPRFEDYDDKDLAWIIHSLHKKENALLVYLQEKH